MSAISPEPQLLQTEQPPTAESLLEFADLQRINAAHRLQPERQRHLGQFLTPAPVAAFLASQFALEQADLRLLDPGAGVGSLTAALLARACRQRRRPRAISVIAYEVDPALCGFLERTLAACAHACAEAGIEFSSELRNEDFIRSAVERLLMGPLFGPPESSAFNAVIMNPPYRKIGTTSPERALLQSVGIETSNLYTAFLALAAELAAPAGELVAITPRSFCNGPYFRPFRQRFLELMRFTQIHVFHSRSEAFGEDDVLQENIVFHATRSADKRCSVTISAREGPGDPLPLVRHATCDELVHADDPNLFIRLITDEIAAAVVRRMEALDDDLHGIGLTVSTGRVVDFRAKSFLRAEPEPGTAPLIYPCHFDNGFIRWPASAAKKPNAIVAAVETEDLLVPSETYVLVKRFSAKEERRRVIAAVYDPARLPAGVVGFENHVNYFHSNGGGLPQDLAKGLAAFLNSTLIDLFVRQFSGHTQVNATDLRSLGYPSREALMSLGARIGDRFPDQATLDALVAAELVDMTDDFDPVLAKTRIDEALGFLRDLGVPRAQQNERSALALLALLDLRPDAPWAEASAPLRGITPMMEFFELHYGKRYAPNTRETVRRFTVHQFAQAGIVIVNPDDPDRPVNSPKYAYQIDERVLEVARSYSSPDYDAQLRHYLADAGTLAKRYARARKLRRIPVRLRSGKTIRLTPGGQNVLLKEIIEEFCPRFTPGAEVIYVGDTGDKWAYWDPALLEEVGVAVDEHGKMPDVLVYMKDRNWLVLIEAVTSHGPVDPKRQLELRRLFGRSSAGLVFVTAFPDRATLTRFLPQVAWETEVWVAEAPTHLIHFNGDRFLGPHEVAAGASTSL